MPEKYPHEVPVTPRSIEIPQKRFPSEKDNELNQLKHQLPPPLLIKKRSADNIGDLQDSYGLTEAAYRRVKLLVTMDRLQSMNNIWERILDEKGSVLEECSEDEDDGDEEDEEDDIGEDSEDINYSFRDEEYNGDAPEYLDSILDVTTNKALPTINELQVRSTNKKITRVDNHNDELR